MSEDKSDLKDGDKTPQGNGQPEKKEADNSQKEDVVQISKSELERIKQDRDNYREGLLANKRKGRSLPGSDTNSDKSNKDDDDNNSQEEFITKKDLKKHIERQAITELQKNSEIDEHWEEIMEFYSPRPGETDTMDGILTAGNRAFKVWKGQQPPVKADKKDDTGDKKVIADIASEKGLNEGKDKKLVNEKKSVLNNKQTHIQDWYK